MHDGTKVKACAGADTFRREERVRRHLQAARQQVEEMGDPRLAEEVSPRVAKARQRGAQEKQQRLEKALEELEKIRACKSSQEEKQEARVSMTDPQARIMKQSDGGFTSRENILAMSEREVDLIGSMGTGTSQSAGQLKRRGVDPSFYPEAFHYDGISDTYTCPAGKILRPDGEEKRPGRTNYKYRACAMDCQACSFRQKCCQKTGAKGRSIVAGGG